MKRAYGLEMRLPEGKTPGFYAQIVKGIAERTVLFDRHKEMLIFGDSSGLPNVLEMLAHYKVEAEPVDLLSAPSDNVRGTDRFDDFAFVSREGRAYFDLAYAAAFRLNAQRPEAETAPALMQLEEHLLAEIAEGDTRWQVIESQLADLAERVARAYECGVEWWDPDRL